jgi:hypothetical protein
LIAFGLPLAANWPDPLRGNDSDQPDIGALPLGAAPPRIGIDGRLSLFSALPQASRTPEQPGKSTDRGKN